MRCPTCVNLKIETGSYFCSQECFKASWKTHKSSHATCCAAAETSGTPPPANKDIAVAAENSIYEKEKLTTSKQLEEIETLLTQRLAELEFEKRTTKATATKLTGRDLERERYTNRKLVQIAAHEGNFNTSSKALAAQYEHKPDTTHDKTRAAVIHHTGSHYHMAGSVQFQRG